MLFFLGRPRFRLGLAATCVIAGGCSLGPAEVVIVLVPPATVLFLLCQHWSRREIMAARLFTGLKP